MAEIVVLTKIPRREISYFKDNGESLSLAYLASFLRQNGYIVHIFDAALEGLSVVEAQNKLLILATSLEPIVIGFTIADMTFINPTIDTIKFLRKNFVTSHLTMGGHSPTFNYKEIFKLCPELDSIIRFEGEVPLLKLCDSIKNKLDWKKLPNLSYSSFGKIQENLPTHLIENLDMLPFPARDYTKYIINKYPDIAIVPLAGSRGCFRNCGFCSIRKFYDIPLGKPWRPRDIKNVVEEIVDLKENIPFLKEVVFIDDNFTGPEKNKIDRMNNLLEEFKKNNIKIMLAISDRADNITDDIAQVWFNLGVRLVLIGLESASNKLLKKFNKEISIQNQIDAINILDRYNIDTAISFINFTPWSTIDDIENNVKHFSSLNINMIQGLLNKYQIYDGTPLAEELRSNRQVIGEYPNFSYISLDERVDKLYDLIHSSFNPFLEIAYKLKLTERKIRILLFDSQIKNQVLLENEIKEHKKRFQTITKIIMDTIADAFTIGIQIVKSNNYISSEEESTFKKYVEEKSIECLRVIDWFSDLCPIFNYSEKQIKL